MQNDIQFKHAYTNGNKTEWQHEKNITFKISLNWSPTKQSFSIHVYNISYICKQKIIHKFVMKLKFYWR